MNDFVAWPGDPRLSDPPEPLPDPAPSWLAALAGQGNRQQPPEPPPWWLQRRAQLARSELDRTIATTRPWRSTQLQWLPSRARPDTPGTFQALLGHATGDASPASGGCPAERLLVMAGKATAGFLPDPRRAWLQQERRGPAGGPCPGPDRRATAGARWSAPRYAGSSNDRLRRPGP